VGCGNLSYSNFLRVPLSSVDQGSEMIGKQAAQMALKLVIEKGVHYPLNKLVKPQLIMRASSFRNLQA
jgi:LacI family transcriptional regulator